MKGRKRKPTNLHLLEGTYRKGRHGTNDEPQPEVLKDDLLEPPEWLRSDAKEEWAKEAPKAVALGTLTESDISSFAHLCVEQANLKFAYKMVEVRNKAVLEKSKGSWLFPSIEQTLQGNVIQNPYVSIYNQALDKLLKLWAEFGMTPSSRTRINVSKPSETNPFGNLGS